MSRIPSSALKTISHAFLILAAKASVPLYVYLRNKSRLSFMLATFNLYVISLLLSRLPTDIPLVPLQWIGFTVQGNEDISKRTYQPKVSCI